MLQIHCPQCSQTSQFLFRTQDYNRRMTRDWFDYYRCGTCDFIFLSPQPPDLGRFYPREYYDLPTSEAELSSRAEHLQQWKLDVVQRFATQGRLLEIGPAYGLFAYLAKRAGFDVTGIEMDSRCCSYLRDSIGIHVVEGANTLELLEQLPSFDVIVLWQVIEHLPDPWAVLAAAAARLAPGGILVIDTPNPDSFQFKVLGSRWTHVDAPRHVTLIPISLLVDRAARHDLSPLWLTATGKSAQGYDSFGWAYSLKGFFGESFAGRCAHFVGRVLTKLLIPIERTGLRGSTYTAVLQKARTP